jgi:ABC-2 type transport system permease protein
VNKTALIFRHEFTTLIRRTGFILMTVAVPLIGLIVILGGQVFSSPQGGGGPVEQVKIGYVDQASLITDHQQEGNFDFVAYGTVEAANQALIGKAVSEYIVIPPDYISNGVIARFTTERQLEIPGDRLGAIQSFMLDNLLSPSVGTAVIDRVKAPANLSNVILDPATGLPAENQGGVTAFLLPYLFSILLVMSIFTSSGYLLQGLAEEKENRIMEVLLSSVSARQLITGKVLGLGAAGLLQMAIWLFSARFLASMASANFSDILGSIDVSATFVILGLSYFILGYLLFAIIMAAVGSIASSMRESQQLAAVFSLMAVSPLWGLVFIIENPQHPVSVFLTIFPFTAPITTMIRVGTAEVPFWQIGLSVVVMAASIFGLLLLSAKVFRTFLLMTGKTPKPGEIFRMLKEA